MVSHLASTCVGLVFTGLLGRQTLWLLHNAAIAPPLQIAPDNRHRARYVVFELGQVHRAAWLDAAAAGTLKLIVDHSHYSHQTVLSSEVAQALVEDYS